MTIVNWPKSFEGLKDDKFYDYGFNFRDIFVEGLVNPFTAQPNKLEFSGDAYGFLTTDQYSGSFVVVEEGYYLSPGVFIGTREITSGTISSFTRREPLSDDIVGTIKGLQIDYLKAAAAAKTAGKSDDMALWAEAFAGNDVFSGSPVSDRLEGFSGNDNLKGRFGADRLFGGEGGDSFVFTSIKDSTVKAAGRDIIYDFSHAQRDKIDLKAIDANTKTTGNQAFRYIGSQDFHKKAGELRWEKVTGGVAVYGDVNGDGKADFSITFKEITKLAKGDFLL